MLSLRLDLSFELQLSNSLHVLHFQSFTRDAFTRLVNIKAHRFGKGIILGQPLFGLCVMSQITIKLFEVCFFDVFKLIETKEVVFTRQDGIPKVVKMGSKLILDQAQLFIVESVHVHVYTSLPWFVDVGRRSIFLRYCLCDPFFNVGVFQRFSSKGEFKNLLQNPFCISHQILKSEEVNRNGL